MKTAERARGKWRGILLTLGVDENFLSAKHGPCPMCGGRDRYRWDNKDGSGSFYCSQCGAGDAIELLKRLKGWDFKAVVRAVDEIVGGVPADRVKPRTSPEQRQSMLTRLWESSMALVGGDPVCRYLASRDVLPDRLPTCLRYVERCPVPHGGGFAAAMIAVVRGPDDVPVNIHRTFLAHPAPGEKRMRAMMPGDLPDGAAVRLAPVNGVRLGIGEGIETSLAAAKRFQVPTWAALNSAMLAKWEPPVGIEEVLIFGDCDPAFGGQAAAYAAAHRLAARRRLKVEVHIPQQVGRDWADRDAA